jgi:catechol 2,3-dioxygenase-like lactoylglutathione lyase family enzyme
MIPERLTIPVSDPSAARTFYARAFGFRMAGHGRLAANDSASIDMDVPGAALTVRLVDAAAGLPIGSSQGAILKVADLEAARAHLRREGVRAGETEEGRFGRYFQVADPDGNGWLICEDPS